MPTAFENGGRDERYALAGFPVDVFRKLKSVDVAFVNLGTKVRSRWQLLLDTLTRALSRERIGSREVRPSVVEKPSSFMGLL